MTSIEKLAVRLRSAQLLRPKLKILFEVAKAMADTANVDPAKNHRTHLAGSKLNTQKVTRARQAMAQVGGEKSYGFRFAALILRLYCYIFFYLVLMLVQAHAMSPQAIPYVGCVNSDIGQTSETSGPDVLVEISPSFKNKISFYADTQRSTGIYAPTGWVCQVIQRPDSYFLEVAPSVADIDTDDKSSLGDPLVQEQFYSADGGVASAVNFYALAASVFPEFFPGGINRWVGDPLRSLGQNPTEGEIKSRTPEGSRQIILRVNKYIAEFITPANTNGLGTVVAGEPVGAPKITTYGVVGIGPLVDGVPMNAEMFSFRLPKSLNYLRGSFIKLSEEEIEKDLGE